MSTRSAPRIGLPPRLRPLPRQQFTLANGLSVCVVPERSTPLVDVEVVIRAGAARDAQSCAGRAAMAAELGARWEPDDRFPARLTVPLRLAHRLRYGENPHQEAALYVRPGADAAEGPLATGGALLAGKPLSYEATAAE